MKHIVCFSGGHSSGIVAIEIARKFGAENTILLNHDISSRVELPDVKRFKKQVADYLGIEITYANHVDFEQATPISVCVDAGTWVNPSNRAILCTHRLKTDPFYKWLKQHYMPGDVCYYGMDANETTRIARRSAIMGEGGYAVDFPLATWQDRTITQTMQVGIDPPLQYDVFNHANCMGCLKAGWQHWYIIYCLMPWLWLEAKQAEAIIGYSIHNDGFLEDREKMFEQMRLAGIPATEKIPSQQFWADVHRAISQPGFDMPTIERAVECMGDCGIERRISEGRGK